MLGLIRFAPYILAAGVGAFAIYVWSDRASLQDALRASQDELAVKDEVIERERRSREIVQQQRTALALELKSLEGIRNEIDNDESENTGAGPRVRLVIERLRAKR